MSDCEYRTGRIIKENLEESEKEEFARQIFDKAGIRELRWTDSFLEMLRDEGEDHGYVVINGDIYRLLANASKDYDTDIFDASENPDGTIDFTLRYYNGGCGFNEALETALDKMNKGNANE